MKPEVARAPPQDDQLMSQGDKLEFQRRPAAKRNGSMEMTADRMVIMPPDRTAITQENPQAFPIVHSFEDRIGAPQDPRRSRGPRAQPLAQTSRAS